ncbi:GCN5-related N-acetyltransferase [Hyella patelloides LEGE 07179]|uniref:GCN5-related N-acetyltransferase n=1 Tax=Hyella patelloides LEGE 07179 TaxID=945734 RepID=A0A563VWU7_9CYAN|nr:GNAT family N-acetyltransferase [Hyella patelloides]VEP15865.1 GCN5-related N-acetyltransferase [Hyella patelloides LEGE 07179]
MSENKILEISRDEQVFSISIEPCDRQGDGQFIRELTRANFYDSLIKTIGWNENRHQEEPKFPERYLMLFCDRNCIGFFSLRDRPHCLYLETLQLVQQFRGRGIGTALLKFVEEIASRRKKSKIQLRVFKDNPVQSLYHRTGFKLVEDEGWCLLMEKVLSISQIEKRS